MPGAWTHILSSNEIINKLKEDKYRKILEDNLKLYQFGAQGPDLFLYYCYFIPSKHKRVEKLGQRLHTDKTRDFILYFIYKLKEIKDFKEFNTLFSYVIGYITHYALDTCMHPYVYYFGGIYHEKLPESKKYDHYHRELESVIGLIQLEKKRKESAYKAHLYEEVNIGKNVPNIVKDTLKKAIKSVYGLKIKNYLVDYCYKDMKMGMKFLTDDNEKKENLFWIIEKFIEKKSGAKVLINPEKVKDDKDYLNKEHKRWNHPCSLEEVTEVDGEELYYKGIKRAIFLIDSVIKYLENEINEEELKKTIPNLSYESGKPLEEYKKMIYFDCIFEKKEN